MSDCEKEASIFKWPKETEPLKTLLLAFAFLCFMNGCRPSSAEPPASLNGRWVGAIAFRGRTDPMIMDFYGASGEWQAFFGKPGLPDHLFFPAVNVHYQDPHISFEIRNGDERLTFAGVIAGDSFKGGARIGEQEMVLELRRTGAAAPRTSQPFTEEAIQFSNGEAPFAGSLLLPSGPGPHPAIVLIHGSGRQSRDEWRIIGMLFARHGVAALLYDKRDVGYEPGGTDLVDLRDLAGDALAAVALLKARNDIRDDQIGLWGISQGGMVAPIAAAQSSDVAYVIAVHELMLSPDAGGGEQLSAEVNRERRIALDYLDTMTGWLREQLGLAR